MGEEKKEPTMLYMDGKPIGKVIYDPKTELVPDSAKGYEMTENGVFASVSPDTEFSCSFRAQFPHVSRKQFITELEKIGYSRKQAKMLAWEIHNRHGSYARASFFLKLGVHPQNCY